MYYDKERIHYGDLVRSQRAEPSMLKRILELRAGVVKLGGNPNLWGFATLPPIHRFSQAMARGIARDLRREIESILRKRARSLPLFRDEFDKLYPNDKNKARLAWGKGLAWLERGGK
jgi:hypothetical protein